MVCRMPIPVGIINELLPVAGRYDLYSFFWPEFAEFRLYLRQYLIARGIASPEDSVSLIEEQDARALLADHSEEILNPFLRVSHVVCTTHQFAPSHFDEADVVLGGRHHG